ncbi:hypothetical protein [Thalassotalea agariperforans]
MGVLAYNKRFNKGRKKLGLRHFVPNFSQAFSRLLSGRYVFLTKEKETLKS